ncbi:hypothetical protein CHLNCDRAFT_145018 [Chlorella variabilis]|uniref:Uncharacterized protein n=1 Tax=Chlorella variabilis TaxID=554065 RepID=E1ZDI3_CHLVA|nr:hypothetical protein CHLNCDRAFT_145018 [Chlorella variabilis]EFN56228.1 hypothetical protein CHLNCDRAFT_145018 [Chlorella variabilis]|eukprot:XP_005848330.1 hypothetical protein CHLNCDRAFT_145018 [Chlorella variabilis]
MTEEGGKPAAKKAKKAAGEKAKKGGDAAPAAKRQKAAEAKPAKQEEAPPPQEAFSMEGQLTRDSRAARLTAPGPHPVQAMDSAAQRGKLRRPGAPGAGAAVGAEDILFLVRKDPRKYARAKELLILDEEIRKAKQVVEDVTAPL